MKRVIQKLRGQRLGSSQPHVTPSQADASSSARRVVTVASHLYGRSAEAARQRSTRVQARSAARSTRPTSAAKLRRSLEQVGRSTGSFVDADLSQTYGEMSPSNGSADFSLLADLLPKTAAAGFDSPIALVAVIVETRSTAQLPYVIGRTLNQLDGPVIAFTGPASSSFLRAELAHADVDASRVMIIELATDHLPAPAYNALLLSVDFWSHMKGASKVLVFQTDSILCPNSDYTIEDFLDFDYIGSEDTRIRNIGIRVDGGSGGLSLRDMRSTMECLERFDPSGWPGGEDSYFAFHFDLMGKRVGRPHECAMFGTELAFRYNSFGAHHLQRWLTKRELSNFLDYCPEAAIILPDVSTS